MPDMKNMHDINFKTDYEGFKSGFQSIGDFKCETYDDAQLTYYKANLGVIVSRH